MTLRLRLVVGLVVLVTIGLAIFGVSTYALYANSERDRLDERIRSAVPAAAAQLVDRAGLAFVPLGGRTGLLPVGTYAELLEADGQLITAGSTTNSDDRPSLPATIVDPALDGQLITVGSAVGSGEWRVSISRVTVTQFDVRRDLIVVVAVPTTEVAESLRRLILIEASAAGVLLVILAVGSWFILRSGLRPLERMATSTRAITSGDLSQRVEPSDGRTEVGQLGLAMNTMLDEIESAFDERNATEMRLRQFLADASHELRTPLTSIQGFAELFRIGAGHPDLDLPVVMRRIEQESARMKVLVDDLLMLARLDRPRPVERTSIDLAVLAADACSDARVLAPDRSITLHAPEPVVIRGDADHLRQAIANLMTNAVRHTADGTAIDVLATFAGADAVVTVRDHGAGLGNEALQRAFDRFWQADAARVGSGSGLGLSIVDGIAREHGGVATATNVDGGGAEFTIRLPRHIPTTVPLAGPLADPLADPPTGPPAS